MERLGDEVARELGRFGPAAGMAALVAAWPKAVGPAIAENAWPARFARDGTLHVATSSSVWAFELTHLAADLRARLGDELGEAAPSRLRFAVGRLPEPGREGSGEERRSVSEPAPDDVEAAGRLAAAIEDEELRSLVARAAAASLARSRSGRAL